MCFSMNCLYTAHCIGLLYFGAELNYIALFKGIVYSLMNC